MLLSEIAVIVIVRNAALPSDPVVRNPAFG